MGLAVQVCALALPVPRERVPRQVLTSRSSPVAVSECETAHVSEDCIAGVAADSVKACSEAIRPVSRPVPSAARLREPYRVLLTRVTGPIACSMGGGPKAEAYAHCSVPLKANSP